MPIQSNVDCMNAYDQATTIVVPQVPTVDPICHHAVHCLTFEILRGWMREGLAVYDDQGIYDIRSPIVQEEALARAGFNPLSAEHIVMLQPVDKAQANSLAENYFEQGYTVILESTSQTDKRNFQRDDGIS
jgi:hypothetical protein